MKRGHGNTWLRTKMIPPKADGENGILPCSFTGRGKIGPAGIPAGGFFMKNPAEGVKAVDGI